MTILELLQQMFNATEEQTTSFANAMKENKIFTSSEENMDIRYGKLKTQHEGLTQQHNEALALIEDMKKSTKGNEDLQQKLSAFATDNEKLKAQLNEALIEGETKVRLLAEGVKPDDIDYVMFKLKAKGELEMGDDGKVKDLDDKVAALKTQLPNQFTTATKKVFEERKLPTSTEPAGGGVTKDEFSKMGYNSRVALRQENPELYDQLMKG